MTHTFRRLAAAATLIMAAAAAHADPVIDGRFDPGEGYSTGQYLNFVLDDGTFVSGGQVWSFVAANGDVSLAFIQPTSINDNSYGTTRIGWGSHNHNLSDLVGSDKVQIQMTNGADNTVLDFTLDYLGIN